MILRGEIQTGRTVPAEQVIISPSTDQAYPDLRSVRFRLPAVVTLGHHPDGSDPYGASQPSTDQCEWATCPPGIQSIPQRVHREKRRNWKSCERGPGQTEPAGLRKGPGRYRHARRSAARVP